MLSLNTARRLKDAGLRWRPTLHDFFALPDRDLDDRVFVIADVMSTIELLHGSPMVSFHGTAEWALDYILVIEAVWLPTEEQLRQLLLRRLADSPESALRIDTTAGQTSCAMPIQAQERSFAAAEASEAYAAALLHLLDLDRLDQSTNGVGA
jgi:hypothetical protein